MMVSVELTKKIVESNSKLEYYSQVSMITVMHTCLFKKEY